MKRAAAGHPAALRGVRAAIALAVLGIFAAPPAAAQVPPRTIAVPEHEVEDVFFAYIVGVLLADAPLNVSGDELLAMFPEFQDGGGQVPFLDITQVRRVPDPEGDGATITITFDQEIEYPVPVDILGYHPGTVYFSRVVTFRESVYPAPASEFAHVRLVQVTSGWVGIDFDRWLDALLGSWVDDVAARVLAVVRHEDHWFALLGGDTPDGGWITGVYDLQSSRIVVRPPHALRELGQEMGK
jgi:hypothetical protein